jgi:hypothetical protein
MKLTYWIADCLDDSDVYSIRERTKKECAARRQVLGEQGYGKPRKVTVEYSDGFDLLNQCTCEGRQYWEA